MLSNIKILLLLLSAFVILSGMVTAQLSTKEKPKGNFISDEGHRTITLTPRKYDDLQYSWEQINSTAVKIIPQNYNTEKTGVVGYEWKLTITYEEAIISTKEKQVIIEKKKVEDLDKEVILIIPEDVNRFNITLGASSTEVAGTAASDGLEPSASDNLCRTNDGILNVVYIDTGSDPHYAYSSDNGSTWTDNEITTDNMINMGILCQSDNTVTIYGTNNNFPADGDIDAYDVPAGTSSFGSIYTIMDSANALSDADCEIDKNDIIHCVAGVVSTTSEMYYVNSSTFDSEDTVQYGGSDDVDNWAISVDSYGNPYIVAQGTDGDDIEVWSPELNGWGDTNEELIYDGISSVATSTIAFKIINVSNDDIMIVAFTEGGDLYTCNSTTAHATVWSCGAIDTSASYQPSLFLSGNADVEILYSNSDSAVSTTALYRANSTDMITYTSRTTLATSGANFPSINPRGIGDEGRIDYVYNDDNLGIFYDNYTIDAWEESVPEPPVDTCTYLGSGTWEINGEDNCVLETTDLNGEDVICTGSGVITGGVLTNVGSVYVRENCWFFVEVV